MTHSTSQFSAAMLEPLCEAIPTWEYGSEGLHNQWRLIQAGLEASQTNPQFGEVAVGLAMWAWQEHPLDKRLLTLLIAFHQQLGCLGDAGPYATAWLERSNIGDVSGWDAIESAEQAAAFITPRLADPQQGLFWLKEGFNWTMDNGEYDLAREIVQAIPTDIPGREALSTRLLAEWAFHALPTTEAVNYVQSISSNAFAPWRARLLATLHSNAGDTVTAADIMFDLWQAMPWHNTLTHLTYSLKNPLPAASIPLGQNAPAILLYSWNKADLLEQTLSTLRDSAIGDCPVFALDNGSSDDTSTMLARMEAEWSGPFSRITLPVNVGAPAARNWLLSLPEVQARPWAAFLDDDIILPSNWLTELWKVADANPTAGSIGCTITDHIAPQRIQCADFHMREGSQDQRSFVDYEEHTFMYCNAMRLRDASLFEATRPCAHVSGCCHMINMESVRTCGPFDVRFSPSQFDDLERDLRSAQAGFPAIHHGALRIKHMQHSSLRQANSRAKSGHIFGNKLKLEHLFPASDAKRLRATTQAMVRQDYIRKTARLLSEAKA